MFTALSHRVGLSKEVSALAVSVDEVDDFELFDYIVWYRGIDFAGQRRKL